MKKTLRSGEEVGVHSGSGAFGQRLHYACVCANYGWFVIFLWRICPQTSYFGRAALFLHFQKEKFVIENCFLAKLIALTESYLMIVSEKKRTYVCTSDAEFSRTLTNINEHPHEYPLTSCHCYCYVQAHLLSTALKIAALWAGGT